MKKILFTLMAVAAGMLVFSCDKTGNEAPKVSLTGESTLSVSAQGGELEIAYSIENPVDGGVVSAEPGQDWIAVVDDKTEGKVTVSVSANDAVEAREGTVAIIYAYSGKEARAEVKIAQAGLPGDVPSIKPETEEVMAFAEGGSYEFSYQISNPEEGATLTVEPKESVDWISAIDCSTANVVKFTIDANISASARNAVLVMKYAYSGGEVTAEVKVSQEGSPDAGEYDVELIAKVFEGIYYGGKFSADAANYWIIVSDNGYTETGYVKPNSLYFRFDIFGEFPQAGNIAVPEGTYVFDPTNGHAKGTMSKSFTIHIYTDAQGGAYAVEYTEAVLEVSREGSDYIFDFEATGVDGKTYHAYYKGAQLMEDKSGGTDPIDGSTIEGDYAAKITGTGSATFWGDVKGNGTGRWTLDIYPNGGLGDGLGLDLYSSNLQYGDFPTGTFTVNSSYGANTLYPGAINGNMLSGSVLYLYELENLITGFALFDAGTVTISKSGSTYTISLNVEDEFGHKVTGEWSGKISSVNESSSPAYPFAAREMLINRK